MGVKPDPYRVWLSEIMLQQTGVKVVEPYFQKFVRKWPKIPDLHRATETEVLAYWSGLGYYSRARNLLKAAKIIDKNYKSEIPNNYEDLISPNPLFGFISARSKRPFNSTPILSLT